MIKSTLNLVTWRPSSIKDRTVEVMTATSQCESKGLIVTMNVTFFRDAILAFVKIIKERGKWFKKGKDNLPMTTTISIFIFVNCLHCPVKCVTIGTQLIHLTQIMCQNNVRR
jgi:hypothetical protein